MPCDLHELAVKLARRFKEGNVQELERELVRARNLGELRTYLARLWRIDRFARFKNQQLRKREWINFKEIVDWCSELGSSADEVRRINAYKWLQDDCLDGDFEDTAGKSRVLYLFHRVSRIRMTRDQLLNILRTHPTEIARAEFLDRCWLERPVFLRWLEKHHLPLSPARFEPLENAERRSMPAVYPAQVPTTHLRRPRPSDKAVKHVCHTVHQRRVHRWTTTHAGRTRKKGKEKGLGGRARLRKHFRTQLGCSAPSRGRPVKRVK